MYIEVKNIHKAFGKKKVLKDISFAADKGQCIGIIGANGCGKSTLLSILAGVQQGKGAFSVNGVNLMTDRKTRARHVGYIPQGTPLIEELTAYDNLLLWYKKSDLEKQIADKNSLINKFGVSEFLKTEARKMSGGMRKRLSIACSAAHNPSVIIMDEPTAALDIICKQTIKNYIAECKAQGKTIIISTHEEQELLLCDSIYVMKDGVLAPFEYNGDINELAERIK